MALILAHGCPHGCAYIRYYFNNDVPKIGPSSIGILEALALHWNLHVDFLLRQQYRMDATVYFIKYEDFLSDRAGSLTRLARSMSFDANASLYIDKHEGFVAPGMHRGWAACQLFTPGEIHMVWRIVSERAGVLGYSRPSC